MWLNELYPSNYPWTTAPYHGRLEQPCQSTREHELEKTIIELREAIAYQKEAYEMLEEAFRMACEAVELLKGQLKQS